MIVRQCADVGLTHNLQVAADEFKLLHLLQSVGVAAPLPSHLDQFGEIFSTPYLVMKYIQGEPEFAPLKLPISSFRSPRISPGFMPEIAHIWIFPFCRIGISGQLCEDFPISCMGHLRQL